MYTCDCIYTHSNKHSPSLPSFPLTSRIKYTQRCTPQPKGLVQHSSQLGCACNSCCSPLHSAALAACPTRPSPPALLRPCPPLNPHKLRFIIRAALRYSTTVPARTPSLLFAPAPLRCVDRNFLLLITFLLFFLVCGNLQRTLFVNYLELLSEAFNNFSSILFWQQQQQL